MDIKGAIYLLMQKCKFFDGMFAEVALTASAQNIPSKNYLEYSFDLTKDGYKPIGVKRILSNQGGNVDVRGFTMSDTSMSVYLYNNHTSPLSTTCLVIVSYAKSPLFGGV